MEPTVRKVANIYEDTRELLNKLKDEFEFKSDDQAIKFMCRLFMEDERSKLLRDYIEVRSNK